MTLFTEIASEIGAAHTAYSSCTPQPPKGPKERHWEMIRMALHCFVGILIVWGVISFFGAVSEASKEYEKQRAQENAVFNQFAVSLGTDTKTLDLIGKAYGLSRQDLQDTRATTAQLVAKFKEDPQTVLELIAQRDIAKKDRASATSNAFLYGAGGYALGHVTGSSSSRSHSSRRR